MLFSELFEHISVPYHAQMIAAGAEDEISSISFLANKNTDEGEDSSYSFNCLYLCSDSTKPTKIPTGIWIVSVPDDFLLLCANEISKQFLLAHKQETEFNQLFYLLMEQTPLHKLIDECASFLDRSLILTDLSFRVIGCSTSRPVTDPVWQNNIARGYCTYEFITAINELIPSGDLPLDPTPFSVNCSASSENKLCSMLMYNHQHIGYLIMLDNELGVLPFHEHYLTKLSALFVQALKQQPVFHTLFVNVAENIIISLLDGESPEIAAQRLSAANLALPDALQCLTFLPKKHSVHDYSYLQSYLQSRFPMGHIFLYHDYIVALIEAHDIRFYREAKLPSFFENVTEIGVSPIFHDISEIPMQLTHALHACEIAGKLKKNGILHLYEDYRSYDLFWSSTEPDLLKDYVHPAFSILSKYDHAKNMDLFETLRFYVLHSLNAKETASALFLHRNTLNYRLNKIRELTSLDFEDPEVLFQLSYSVRILDLIQE